MPPIGAQVRCQPVPVEQAERQRSKARQGERLHRQAETVEQAKLWKWKDSKRQSQKMSQTIL